MGITDQLVTNVAQSGNIGVVEPLAVGRFEKFGIYERNQIVNNRADLRSAAAHSGEICRDPGNVGDRKKTNGIRRAYIPHAFMIVRIERFGVLGRKPPYLFKRLVHRFSYFCQSSGQQLRYGRVDGGMKLALHQRKVGDVDDLESRKIFFRICEGLEYSEADLLNSGAS